MMFCSTRAGKAADRETHLSEFLRDVVGDLRERVATLEPELKLRGQAPRRRAGGAGEADDVLTDRIVELESENGDLAGLLVRIRATPTAACFAARILCTATTRFSGGVAETFACCCRTR